MATDATITQTNKDFFTGSSYAIPLAAIVAGAYFWGKGPATKNYPKDSDVRKVLTVSLVALGGVILYQAYRREHPPVVSGDRDYWTFQVRSHTAPHSFSNYHETYSSRAAVETSPAFRSFIARGASLNLVNLNTGVVHPYHY